MWYLQLCLSDFCVDCVLLLVFHKIFYVVGYGYEEYGRIFQEYHKNLVRSRWKLRQVVFIKWSFLFCSLLIFDISIFSTWSNCYFRRLSVSIFQKHIFQFSKICCCFCILSTNLFDEKSVGNEKYGAMA